MPNLLLEHLNLDAPLQQPAIADRLISPIIVSRRDRTEAFKKPSSPTNTTYQYQPLGEQIPLTQTAGPTSPDKSRSGIQQDTLLLTPAQDMPTFNKQAQIIGEFIVKIETGVHQLKRFQSTLKTETDSTAIDRIIEDMNSIKRQIESLTMFARDGLKMLHKSQRGNKNERQRVYQNLLARLQTVIISYKDVQEVIQSFEKKEFERQLRIVNPNISDAEIANAIQSGQRYVFADAILQNRKVLHDVQTRQNELVKLVESLTQLSEIMTELNALINSQQEMIDLAEINVDQAVNHMERGIAEVDVGIKHAKNARATQWKIFAIAGVIALILLIIIIYYVMQAKKTVGTVTGN
ncbi:UNVERIFIED_CONTAM: hypothetical protein HDU68_006309 [Siphonaria sp. JEL0065]|nr:hypothetical protein HDU68_006309 [Siphonaria sp. JEL0065]